MTHVDITTQSQSSQDLFFTLATIADAFGGEVWVEDARAEHGAYAVWLGLGAGGDDIVATGETIGEALDAATVVARGWE